MITRAPDGVCKAWCLAENPEPSRASALRASAALTNTEETFVVTPDFAYAQFYCVIIGHQSLLLLTLAHY